MPSRTAMVLAQNGLSSAGDPFLGLLVRGAFAIGKGISKIFRKPKLVGAITRRATTVLQRIPAGRIARGAAVAAGAGAAFEVGSRIVGTDAAGQPIFAKRRRRRGITATELRGFRKITSLLHRVGMTPRGLGRIRHHAHHS